MKAKVLGIEKGYWFLRLNNNVMDSLENLFSTSDTFTGPYIKDIKDIDFEKVYLTSYMIDMKGRVKVTDKISNSQVRLSCYILILITLIVV